MGRRQSNARPPVEVAPVILAPVTELTEIPTVAELPVGERHHAFRDAAKHAPSRLTSRMYAQVRAVTAALDEAQLHLGRVTLPTQDSDAMEKEIASYRRRLQEAREGIPDASHDRAKADEVKAELAHLESVTRLLDPAIVALAHHAKAAQQVAGRELDEREQVAWNAARAAAASVWESLATGRPGVISSAVARLRDVGTAAA